MAKVDTEKFKNNRALLMTYAAKHPGALTAHFLSMLRQRVKGPMGVIRKTSDLRDVSAVTWMQAGGSNLSELRDVREATALCCILDSINRNELSMALDVLTRMHAVMTAKTKGGTWEKAARLELIPASTGDLLPAGLSGLAC